MNVLKKLNVELTEPEIYHDFDNSEEPGRQHTVVGICRWENSIKGVQQ